MDTRDPRGLRTEGRVLNWQAWLYDPILERLSFGLERRFRERTLELLEFAPEDRVLDVGCGTGTLTIGVARRLRPPGRAVGVDAAPNMIRLARRKALRNAPGVPVEFELALAEALPFDDGRFDRAVNSMFAHHLNSDLKARAFAEMFRVLRPGGTLLTVDVDRPTTLAASLLGWGARIVLRQEELAGNLEGLVPRVMARAGFVQLRRADHVYGLVSFYTALRP